MQSYKKIFTYVCYYLKNLYFLTKTTATPVVWIDLNEQFVTLFASKHIVIQYLSCSDS